jgi:hypothetical protein
MNSPERLAILFILNVSQRIIGVLNTIITAVADILA